MKPMANRKKRHPSPISQKLILSGIFFLLCLILPLLTDAIPAIGPSLRLTHIPILLCGFLCGWPYGLFVGFFSSLAQSLLFSIPMFPDGLCLGVELAAYGAMAGLMYCFLPRNLESIYTALVISMITGRVLWGVSRLIFSHFGADALTLEAFWEYTALSCIPGILLSLILVPLITLAFQQASFMKQ